MMMKPGAGTRGKEARYNFVITLDKRPEGKEFQATARFECNRIVLEGGDRADPKAVDVIQK